MFVAFVVSSQYISLHTDIQSAGAEFYSHYSMITQVGWFPSSEECWMEVVGKRPRGRPRKTWMSTLKEDMKKGALSPEDARDRDLWRRSIHGAKRPTRVNLEML
jgi:hypothetical protein